MCAILIFEAIGTYLSHSTSGGDWVLSLEDRAPVIGRWERTGVVSRRYGTVRSPPGRPVPRATVRQQLGPAAPVPSSDSMPRLLLCAAVLAWLAAVRAEGYCEDFESGELAPFWSISELDSRGHWKATSYDQLQQKIPDFPAPAQGDVVAYLTADPNQIYVYARLQMSDEYVLPAGSSVSLRYWLRTDYPGSGTLEVRRQVDGVEEKEPLVSLTDTSGPNNTRWMELSAPIPDSSRTQKVRRQTNRPQN